MLTRALRMKRMKLLPLMVLSLKILLKLGLKLFSANHALGTTQRRTNKRRTKISRRKRLLKKEKIIKNTTLLLWRS